MGNKLIIRNSLQHHNEDPELDVKKLSKIDPITPIDQLSHHGIKGMKWGVRRYQNPDGTRTPEGKRRENDTLVSGPDAKSQKKTNKQMSKLSNEELKKINDRLQLEETYKRLTTSDVKKGESWVKKALTTGGEQALTAFTKGLFLGGAILLVKEVSPQFAELAFKVKEKDDNKN